MVGVTDPMAKVRPGLVGSGDQEVELKGVHIRAKLLDLAGEVCLLLKLFTTFHFYALVRKKTTTLA